MFPEVTDKPWHELLERMASSPPDVLTTGHGPRLDGLITSLIVPDRPHYADIDGVIVLHSDQEPDELKNILQQFHPGEKAHARGQWLLIQNGTRV